MKKVTRKNLSVAVVKPSSSVGYMSWKYMRFPPMGGPLIASFLNQNGYNATFVDLDFKYFEPTDYDVVLVSMLTPEAPEGYELADRCRELGVPVIGGGYHATFETNEAKKHFDIVVKRDGIPIVMKAIDKVVAGKRGVLQGDVCSAKRLKLIVDNSILDRDKYVSLNCIITSFGCYRSCSFCTVWKLYKKKIYWRDDNVIKKEIKNFKKGVPVFILDDDLDFVKPTVFKLLKKHNYKFVGEANINFVKSEKFKVAVDCGLSGIALGFESTDNKILKKINKKTGQKIREYDEIINTVKDNGLGLFGFFVLDPDVQTKEDMEQLVDYTIDKKFDFVQFSMMTPYPGTELRKQLKGRIFDNNWKNYTTLKCVFHPKKMSHKEADKMVEYANKRFYSTSSILRRLPHTKRLDMFLGGNMTAKIATRKVWK